MAADTWGLSWGGTGGAWLTSWASTYVPPIPEPVSDVVPAGRRTQRRYYVEVDGEAFEVDSAQQALRILDRAKELAVEAAEEAAKKVEAKAARSPKPRPIRIQAPKVTVSPELKIDLAPYRKEIEKIYDSAAALAEMRLLMQRAIDEDDEEILLLM